MAKRVYVCCKYRYKNHDLLLREFLVEQVSEEGQYTETVLIVIQVDCIDGGGCIESIRMCVWCTD